MALSDPRTIKTLIESADGIDRLTVFERNDGFYAFLFEEQLLVEGHGEFEDYTYWSTVHLSGLYETFEEAQRAAVSETPWARAV